MTDRPPKTWLWIPASLACAVLLFVALVHPSEYGFYTLARIAVAGTAVLLGVVFGERDRPGLVTVMIALAIVFNPLFPLSFGRDVWLVLDLLAIPVLLAGTALAVRRGSTA